MRNQAVEEFVTSEKSESRDYKAPLQESSTEEAKTTTTASRKPHNPRSGGHRPMGTKGLSNAVFQRNKITQKREEVPITKPAQTSNGDDQHRELKESGSGYIRGLKTEKPNYKPSVQRRPQ